MAELTLADVAFLRWAATNPASGALMNVGCGDGRTCRVLASTAAMLNRGPVICIDPFPDVSAFDPWQETLRDLHLRQHIFQLRHPSEQALAFCRERGVRLRLALLNGGAANEIDNLRRCWELLDPGGIVASDNPSYDFEHLWIRAGSGLFFVVKP